MKQCMFVVMVAALIVSCKKTGSINANILFYNGTWSVPAITAAWNGSEVIATPIVQGAGSGTASQPYLQLPAGTNLVTLRAGTDTLINKNIYTTASSGSSFLFYDTSMSVPAVRVLQLTDDLSATDTAEIKYRFLHVSPDTSAIVDLWLVNGNTDSLRLDTAGVFMGRDAEPTAVQPFSTIKYHGQAYTIKAKKTGTEQLYASIASYTFMVKSAYSIVFSGLASGSGNTAFKLSVLHHPTQ